MTTERPDPSSALVVDTGPVVALMNTADQHHEACVRLLLSAPGPLLIPEPLITEIAYIVGSRGGPEAEARFLEDTLDGPFAIVSLTIDDRRRVIELVRAYASLPLRATDACVIALAERFDLHWVATLDRRRFSAVRPEHVPALTLVP